MEECIKFKRYFKKYIHLITSDSHLHVKYHVSCVGFILWRYDVSWLACLYMMTASNGHIFALLALCAGNSPVTGEFPSQRQWQRALMFSLIYAWTNGWVNNSEAGDLRRRRAHYDVTAMILGVYICGKMVFISKQTTLAVCLVQIP